MIRLHGKNGSVRLRTFCAAVFVLGPFRFFERASEEVSNAEKHLDGSGK